MNHRQRIKAVMHYEKYDRLPLVFFGWWPETLKKWCAEGHITQEMVDKFHGESSPGDRMVMDQLGIDFNWARFASGHMTLRPEFPTEILNIEADGSKIIRNGSGLIQRIKDGVTSIPAEIGTTLTGREAWESMYLEKLQYCPERVSMEAVARWRKDRENSDIPLGIFCGSLYGSIRDMLGVQELSYLAVDDEELYVEIIDTIGNLCFKVTEQLLSTGIRFDYAHFWEDICFRNGPLVRPDVFRELVGPHYKRITSLVRQHGIDIISLDCDGYIDHLLPIWMENGVNTMFPIEVGTWNASIAPWQRNRHRVVWY